MNRLIVTFTVLLVLKPASPGGLEKIGQVDLRQILHDKASMLRNDEHPVQTISFSPKGDLIAILTGVHPKQKGFWSDLVIVEATHPDRVIGRFEVNNASSTPAIRWSTDSRRLVFDRKVFAIDGSSYCGRGEVVGLLGSDRFLSLTPAETITVYGVQEPAMRLSIVGPGCADEVRVPTHELNWELQDVSSERNLGLFARLYFNKNKPGLLGVRQFIVVHFPEGSIVRSWEVGSEGRFINAGAGVCFGSGIDNNEPVTSACWEVETGNKIADIPANGGFPIMPASNAPRVIVSDLRWHRWIVFDGGRSVVHRRTVWDYSMGRELVSWSPGSQTYHDGWMHRVREEPFPCALSPDGKIVIEGGNGVLRLYKITP